MYLTIKQYKDNYVLEITIPDGVKPTGEDLVFVQKIVETLGLVPPLLSARGYVDVDQSQQDRLP